MMKISIKTKRQHEVKMRENPKIEKFPLTEKSEKSRSMSRERRVREKLTIGNNSHDREKSENLHERETINYLVKEKWEKKCLTNKWLTAA